ncbi:unnamed protein product [Coffea canephora]|uniref:Beta-glucosidase n=1 Tax=Coffea canephora TaxID=49390 RepID=A0A068UGN5_COFCA|nr:unnamed protein product [Coffea canephora]
MFDIAIRLFVSFFFCLNVLNLLYHIVRKVNEGENANVACYSYKLYKEDAKIAKNIGLDSYRFSISWTRVLPGGRLSAGVNREGIQYYNNLIEELLAKAMFRHPTFVTLHHFEVPQVLEEQYGGFLSDKIILHNFICIIFIILIFCFLPSLKDFLEFAELCFWEFGDRVKFWTTFNEPWTFIYKGYVAGKWPPCRVICEDGDPGREPYTVSRNLLLAHAEAVHLYRKKFKTYNTLCKLQSNVLDRDNLFRQIFVQAQGGQIGIVVYSSWFEPFTQSERNKEAAQRALDFQFGRFMDPITYGQYPKSMTDIVPPDRLQRFSEEESGKLRGSYDFLGLNYYTARYAVASDPKFGPPSYDNDQHCTSEKNSHALKTEKCVIYILLNAGNDWIYIYPKGINKLLCAIKQLYNDPPIYVTENGVADANNINYTVCEARKDEVRITYLREHLKEIRLAMIEKRVNVKGYFVWALLGNFEWASGYKDRFGLVYVNFKDRHLSRFPKVSALWYMNFLGRKYRPIQHQPPPTNGLLEDEKLDITSNSAEMVVSESPNKRPRKI